MRVSARASAEGGARCVATTPTTTRTIQRPRAHHPFTHLDGVPVALDDADCVPLLLPLVLPVGVPDPEGVVLGVEVPEPDSLGLRVSDADVEGDEDAVSEGVPDVDGVPVGVRVCVRALVREAVDAGVPDGERVTVAVAEGAGETLADTTASVGGSATPRSALPLGAAYTSVVSLSSAS